MVQARSGMTAAEMKPMIQRVMDAVQNCSKDKIQLVLTYYEYNVQNTIQAFIRDGAQEALSEWRQPQKSSKKKKGKGGHGGVVAERQVPPQTPEVVKLSNVAPSVPLSSYVSDGGVQESFGSVTRHIQSVFEALHNALNDRETQLLVQMDKLKVDSNTLLSKRKQQIEQLRVRIRNAEMTPGSESLQRHLNQELRTLTNTRSDDTTCLFVCNPNELVKAVEVFGRVHLRDVSDHVQPQPVQSRNRKVPSTSMGVPTPVRAEPVKETIRSSEDNSRQQKRAGSTVPAIDVPTTNAVNNPAPRVKCISTFKFSGPERKIDEQKSVNFTDYPKTSSSQPTSVLKADGVSNQPFEVVDLGGLQSNDLSAAKLQELTNIIRAQSGGSERVISSNGASTNGSADAQPEVKFADSSHVKRGGPRLARGSQRGIGGRGAVRGARRGSGKAG